MAKDRLHNLKETENSFEFRGKVTGTKSKRFYSSGAGKNGGAWNVVEFGVEIDHHKSVFVKLNGYTRDAVYYYKRGEKGEKGTSQRVAWKDRNKAPGKDYRLIGINISVDKDENGKNINKTFVEYDAVEWIHENLQDGDSVFIKGKINFSSYINKNGETRRKMDFVPTQISYTGEPIDFDAEDYKPRAEFENTLVFSSIEKETDERDKATGRFILSGYSVGYNTVEPVSFIMEEKYSKLAAGIRKKMKPGNSIKTFGRVVIENNIEEVDPDDAEWGITESSPMKRVNAPVKREYMVYDIDTKTFDKETYTEESINEAIRKVNAAKQAAQNFGDKASSVDNDWSSLPTDDDDMPWD